VDENGEFDGQIIHPEMSFIWVKVGPTIPAGHLITPVHVPKSRHAEEFAALHLIINDLELALYCFEEALKKGLPDDTNKLVRALIAAGVLAYVKPFDQGLRRFKLSPQDFADRWSEDSKSIHAYLHDLRQKHVAHSINDCERSDAIGIVVLSPDGRLDKEGPSGVGATVMSSIGLTKAKLRQSIVHIHQLTASTKLRIEQLRILVHDDLRKQIHDGKDLKMIPMVRFPDRTKVAERRD
jgi:hypothetical protein